MNKKENFLENLQDKPFTEYTNNELIKTATNLLFNEKKENFYKIGITIQNILQELKKRKLTVCISSSARKVNYQNSNLPKIEALLAKPTTNKELENLINSPKNYINQLQTQDLLNVLLSCYSNNSWWNTQEALKNIGKLIFNIRQELTEREYKVLISINVYTCTK